MVYLARVLVFSEAAWLWINRITVVYWLPLVSGLGWRGIRFTSIEANPLARVSDTLETRWEVVIPSPWPVWRATVLPSRCSWSTMVKQLSQHGNSEARTV